MSIRALRIGAILLPAALLLHEAAYALAGGGLIGAHHYLHVLVPVAAAAAASMAFASLLLPSLGRSEGRAQPFMPLALAGALLGIFVAQELAEATLLGGGAAGLSASLSVGWLAPPLALLLGALAGAAIVALDRTAQLLASPAAPRPLWPRERALLVPPGQPRIPALACGGLRFGFARRPPPLAR